MADESSLAPKADVASKTFVRHALLSVLTLMSVLLYLDRFAVGIASEYIRQDLRMSQTQMAWFISAFFWSYALCQVPAGWLSDRFGGRIMLTIYIVAWSVFTGMMGLAQAVWIVLWLRLFCGAAQAGAYPTSVSLIRQWYPMSNRGTASSIVGLGGRFGAVLAPILTAWLIIYYVPMTSESRLVNSDILDAESFVAKFDDQTELGTPRQKFVTDFLARLPESERESLMPGIRDAVASLETQAPAVDDQSKRLIDLRDWFPFFFEKQLVIEKRTFGLNEILEPLANQMSETEFLDFDSIPIRLVPEGQSILDRRQKGTVLTEPETIRLNRLALESLFPKEIVKVQGPGWRPTMVLYGFAGLIVAFTFAIVTRNTPARHPWCNEAERNFVNDAATQAARRLEPGNPSFPWRAFLTSASLWGNSLTQFLTNVGWLFVVTWLPRYLDDVHGVPLVTKGIMTAFPSGIGIVGLFLGGRATDLAVQKFGLKRGRQIPLAASRFTAAAGYALCLILSLVFSPSPENWWLPWLYIVGLCIASMSTDFGSPAIWAYAQDVGGRYSASILGWGNMWGNLGAAVAPLVYNRILGEKPTLADWNTVFVLCCGVFVVSGFCALLLDSTKPLTVERNFE
jgi:ACS family glucarate transporter-like MFS transporter